MALHTRAMVAKATVPLVLLLGLAGCRVARDAEPADKPVEPTPPPVHWVPNAPALNAQVSLLLWDAGTRGPLVLLANQASAQVAAVEPDAGPAHEPAHETPETPASAPRPSESAALPQPVESPEPEPATEQAPLPAPPQLAVIIAGVGLDADVLAATAKQACRALAANKPLWPTLDEALSALSCALRATGRAPREALVMGSDGRLGATGALPFDLDPARVAARVREAKLGSVVADPARAAAGIRASFRCALPDAQSASKGPADAGFAGLLLRDATGAVTGGLVSAPEGERAEGYLGAAVFPGDYLHVQPGRAVLLFGADAILRARGRARELAMRDMDTTLGPDHPLFKDVTQLVWLDDKRVGSIDPEVTRFEWRREAVPEACRTEEKP